MQVEGSSARFTPTVETDAPQWLADFLIQPPLWFKVVIVVTALGCIGLAARYVYLRESHIPTEKLGEIALILADIEGVTIGVVVATEALDLSYGGDVVVGLIAGLAVVEVGRRIGAPVVGWFVDDRTQLLIAWGVLLFVGQFAPQAGILSGVRFPQGFMIAATTVALLGGVWTLLQEFGPGETVAEAVQQTEM